jgi:O-antigen ligase
MVFQSVRPYVPMLALLSLAIIFLGRFWWPGEASAWAGSARFALLSFLIVYLLSGEIGKGFKSKALLVAVGLLVSWIVLNFLLVGGDSGVLRRSIVLMVFVCAVVVLKDTRADWLRKLLMVVVVVATVAALVTLIYQLRARGLDFKYRAFRLSNSGVTGFAQFGNPIISGLYMAFAGLAALWCTLCTQRLWFKAFWLFALLVIGLYVFLTFSRTAWLAIGLGGAVLFIFQAKRDSFLLAIGVALTIFVSLVFWRFPEILSVELERGATGRHLIWNMVLSSMSGYWWLGHGAGSSMQPMSIPGQQVVNTHSLYLEVLFQYGIVGLALFVSSLLLALRQLWLERSEMAVLGLCLLVGSIGVMFFDLYSFIHSPNLVWLWVWFPLGLALACSKDGAR